MKKLFIAVLILLAILIGAFFALNSYIYNEKQAENDGTLRTSLQGEYVCLPAKDQNTALDECAAGILANGEYYAIDLGLMSQETPQLTQGDMLTANGIVTPIETLSTDYWDRFPVVGIFSVTDSLQVMQDEGAPTEPMVYKGLLPCASCSGIDTTLELSTTDQSGRAGTYLLTEVYQDDEPLTVTTTGNWGVEEVDGQSFFILTDATTNGDDLRYRINSAASITFAGLDGSALESDLPYELLLTTQQTPGSIFDRPWVWTYTEKQDGSRIEAPEGEEFVLTLSEDGRYTSTTDCNNIAGDFVHDSEVLSFGAALSTKMFCEGSLEMVYTNDLLLTNAYKSDGAILQLNLNRDYGVMYFRAQ